MKKKIWTIGIRSAFVILLILITVFTVYYVRNLRKPMSLSSILTDASSGVLGFVRTDKNGNKRFAGKNPNNYVCFGIEGDTCDEDHLYRMIGMIDGKPKLIKNSAYSNELSTSNIETINRFSGLDTAKKYLEYAEWPLYEYKYNWYVKSTFEREYEIHSDYDYLYRYEDFISEESVNSRESYIGLINVTDYAYASGSKNCERNNHIIFCEDDNWLNDGINLKDLVTRSLYHMNSRNGIRVVLFLNQNMKIKKGSGIKADPYILIYDNKKKNR